MVRFVIVTLRGVGRTQLPNNFEVVRKFLYRCCSEMATPEWILSGSPNLVKISFTRTCVISAAEAVLVGKASSQPEKVSRTVRM